MSPAEVTAEFRSWVDVPWVHQGRTRNGIDCAGLFVVALENLDLLGGFKAPVVYGREPQHLLAALVEEHCTRTEQAVEGVLVLIRWVPSQPASHLAYCTGRNLIHAYSRTVGRARVESTRLGGRVIEHRYGEPWLRQTAGLYRIRGVEYLP